MLRRTYYILLWVQGVYTFVTALWALIDVDSFMKVTGPKHDVWLLKTVSALLLALGIGMITEAIVRSYSLPLLILILTSSIGLAIIDFYYSGKEVIWDIYKLDGAAQICFIVLWCFILSSYKSIKTR